MNTLKALADFIGASVLEDTVDLTPDIFFKRTEQSTNQSYAELYFRKSPFKGYNHLLKK